MEIRAGIRCLTLVKKYETLQLKAYKPTPNDVWTIGYGHTKSVFEGMSIDEDQANIYLYLDLGNAIKEVQDFVNRTNVYLTQSMIDALISLEFNIGTSGTALDPGHKMHDHLLDGNYYEACAAMFSWRKQGNKDLLGLARRRLDEMKLFLEDGVPTK